MACRGMAVLPCLKLNADNLPKLFFSVFLSFFFVKCTKQIRLTSRFNRISPDLCSKLF